MNLKIKYNSNNILNQNDIQITLDKKIVENIVISDDVIEFNSDSKFGFHMIKMSSKCPVFIKDLKLDDNSLRELKYWSFLLENNKKLQPRTDIQNLSQLWCMPIIYPLSAFFSFSQNNLPNGYLGKNLFDYFDIFFPESVEISSNHPKILRDYFSYDAHFSIIPKHQISNGKNTHKPFEEINFQYDEERIFVEIKKNLLSIDFGLDKPHQYDNNKDEFQINDPWKKSYFIKSPHTAIDNQYNITSWEERFVWKKQEWPCLFELLKNLPAKNIINGYLAELPNNTFIFPHNDNNNEEYFKKNNISTMYIPLCSPENVFFKFANYGLVNLKKSNLIDNKRFSHSVVNESGSPRYILNINFVPV